MPFKSKAQKRKFAALLAVGEITQETYDKMAEGTPNDLPERAAGRPLKTGIRRPKYTKRYK